MGLFDKCGTLRTTPILPTAQKALEINRDRTKYGTFAEIGAGQEVVRWFFLVGGASGTVAKSMSAYDMTVSDAVYGKTERYVSKQRLLQMLNHEYSLNVERLSSKVAPNGRLFAFADTVATKSSRGPSMGHGWMGIRFQQHFGSELSQILIHVNMLDNDAADQQETLGIVGVNLVYGAFQYENPVEMMDSLMDNLSRERIEIDMVEFSGEKFASFDNRLAALWLLRLNLSEAAMLGPKGEVLQPSDVIFRRPVLVERGSFNPVTLTHLDILDCAKRGFLERAAKSERSPVVLMEMTTSNLIAGGELDPSDFLARVEMLNSVGHTVLVTDFPEYYRLAEYLRRYTQEPCGLALSVGHLKELFEEKYYEHLDGGILEGLGLLFKTNFTFYTYPVEDEKGNLVTAERFQPPSPLEDIYRYLLRREAVVDVEQYHPECLSIYATDVAKRIRAGDEMWTRFVPPSVAELIAKRNLYSN